MCQATGLPPKEALLKLLQECQTIIEISRKTSINRTALYQAMAYFKIERPQYSHSAHMKEWYKGQPSDMGMRLTKKAHEAVRGMTRDRDEKIRRAITHQEYQRLSKNEITVAEIFKQFSIEVTCQLAVDIYNIDIAIPSLMLAIEINGGNWHTAKRKAAADQKKRQYLESHGWHVIYLWGTKEQISNAAHKIAKTIQSGHNHQLLRRRHFSTVHLKIPGDQG